MLHSPLIITTPHTKVGFLLEYVQSVHIPHIDQRLEQHEQERQDQIRF